MCRYWGLFCSFQVQDSYDHRDDLFWSLLGMDCPLENFDLCDNCINYIFSFWHEKEAWRLFRALSPRRQNMTMSNSKNYEGWFLGFRILIFLLKWKRLLRFNFGHVTSFFKIYLKSRNQSLFRSFFCWLKAFYDS